jgi:hypothetical protein
VGSERGSNRRDGGDDLTKAQYKHIQNCHNESPLFIEYILKEMKNMEELG